MLNSAEFAQLSWAWKKFQNFISILRFINKTNFLLSWVEHEKKFYNLGARNVIGINSFCGLHRCVKADESLINCMKTEGFYVKFVSDLLALRS